jgi:hypothetical protein
MESYDIIIYCGGKCGSCTLYNTFLKNGYKCFYTHTNMYWMQCLKNDIPVWDIIDHSCKNKKVYIIDSYRNPIERRISCFFQNIEFLLPNYKSLSIEEIIEWYTENRDDVRINERYNSINEVLDHYDIPFFETFDFEKRYNILEKDNKVFIKILFSDIHDWGSILSEIFEKEIVVHPDNLTSDKKDVISLYNEFKSIYRPPQSYIYGELVSTECDPETKFTTEFTIYNTPEQQEEYIRKWTA